MDRTKARRRRVAFGVLLGLALGAFALGAALGDEGTQVPQEVEVASTLAAPQLAGERVVAGLPGTGISPRLRKAVRQGRIAGVVLFEASFPTRAAGRRLIAGLQRIKRPRGLRDPLLIMVDQEGGLVKRVDGAPTLSARQIGNRGAATARQQGARTAANLRSLGVNVDLAPVLDLGLPGGTIAETERAFGATPKKVIETAIPFAQALQAGGVAATAKHFPGFGAAGENTDFAVEEIDLPKAKLRALDEAPFAAFAQAGGDLVMLSTAIYPAFSERPAAFARPIVTGELRGRLGFDGVTVTDALGTVAVEDFGGPAVAGLAAVRAGVDLLLFNDLNSAEAGWKALVSKLRARKLPRAEFEAAVQRVLDLREKLRR